MSCIHQNVRVLDKIKFCDDCKRVIEFPSRKEAVETLAREGFTVGEIIKALDAQTKDQKKYIRRIFRRVRDKDFVPASLQDHSAERIVDYGVTKAEIEGLGQKIEGILLRFIFQLEMLENTIKHLSDKVADLTCKLVSKGELICKK